MKVDLLSDERKEKGSLKECDALLRLMNSA
jgi:hypothetical protein